MKVEVLRQFLLSLRGPIEAADPRTSLAVDLDEAAALINRFADYDLNQFGAFLARAAKALEHGQLSVPGPAETGAGSLELLARRLDASLARLKEDDDTAEIKSEVGRLKGDLQFALKRLVGPYGMTVTIKDDAKWFDKHVSSVKAVTITDWLRQRLRGVTDPAELQGEVVQSTLDELTERAGLDLVKAIALECDIKPTGRDARKILNTVAEKITGLKIPKAPVKSKAAKALDREAVERQAKLFRSAMDKSFEPGGLSHGELEDRLEALGSLEVPELKAVAAEVGLTLTGRTKKAILDAFRERLTEARRAEEGIEV